MVFKKEKPTDGNTNKKETRVSKKDKFQLKKRSKVEIYVAPKYLNQKYGLFEVTKEGLFLFKSNKANKLYSMKVGERCNKAEAFQILRNYDNDFSVFYTEKNDYLLITINESTMEAAKESFDTLEADMIVNLQKNDVSLKELSFQERMEIIHDFLTMGVLHEKVSVTDYLDNVLGYKADFFLNSYDVSEEEYLGTDSERVLDMLFIRKNMISLDNPMREIMELPFVKVCKFDYECIPDRAVAAFIENTYMGFDKEKKHINKVNPDLYDVLIGRETDEDKKLFTSIGLSILTENERGERTENLKQIEHILERYSVSFEYYYGNMLNNFLSFVPFMSETVKQNRLQQAERSLAFFLAGKGKKDEEDSSLTEFFQSETKYVEDVNDDDEPAFQYDDDIASEEVDDDFEIEETSKIFDYIV